MLLILMSNPTAITRVTVPAVVKTLLKRFKCQKEHFPNPSLDIVFQSALSTDSVKEHIWHQWMLKGLVKNMDIHTRNALAHFYVDARLHRLKNESDPP